jgi:hypothetical protein
VLGFLALQCFFNFIRRLCNKKKAHFSNRSRKNLMIQTLSNHL